MELSMFEETNSQSQFQAGKVTSTLDLIQLDEATLVFTVIFSFVVLVIFIIMFSDKLFIETSSTLQLQVPELSMVVAKIPFQVEFQHLEGATMIDGVDMNIHVEEPIKVVCYWGASCTLLINAMNDDPRCLFSQDVDLEHVDHKSFEVHPEEEEEVFHIATSCSADILNFGTPPRSKYPLVILTRCLDRRAESQDNLIVGGVWILHLPDTSFNQPGHIVSNLVITNHRQVHNLQKMYLAADSTPVTANEHDQITTTSSTTSDSTSSTTNNTTSITTSDYNSIATSSITTSDSTSIDSSTTSMGSTTSREEEMPPSGFDSLVDGQHDCAVCQNGPISRVILPCRHACVCERCFKLVTKCPMCRGPVVSHFCLHPGTQQIGDLDVQALSDSWMDYLQGLCNQLNRRFGFT